MRKMKRLQGKIEFTLCLNDSSSEFGNSRKRKRPVSSTDSSDRLSGFFFRPAEASLATLNTECQYLLSVSCCSSRQVSQAAAHRLSVSISRYSLVQLKGASFHAILIEVHQEGLELIQDLPFYPLTEIWSLSHFRLREIVEGMEMVASNEPYSISGIVDAISPIICLDPRNPFCLMELNDARNNDITCVVGFFGDQALIWQSSIQPAEHIQLHGLRRKRWQVPESFNTTQLQFLKERVPSYIFVFSGSARISWDPSTQNSAGCVSIHYAMPSPLRLLQGTIFAVKRKTLKRGGTTVQLIEYIDIECESGNISGGVPEASINRLFLSHFPMSTELQLSLQPRATIRAVNVHFVGFDEPSLGDYSIEFPTFSACLRSTIVLLSASTDENNSNETERSVLNLVPHRLAKVTVSHRDRIFKLHAQRWLDNQFRGCDNENVASLPTPHDLLVHYQPSNGQRKNPYAEFFDHALDEEHGSNSIHVESSGCCNSREELMDCAFPRLLGLNDLRVAALQVLAKRFRSTISRDGNLVSKGWSGALHLPAQELFHNYSGTREVAEVVVGGYVFVNKDTGNPVSLADSLCQLSVRFKTASPMNKGDFVVGSVSTVVVSCFCLWGQQGSNDIAPNLVSEDSVNIQSLPPLQETLFENVMGAGALLRLGNYMLVASVQLHCQKVEVVSRLCDVLQTPHCTPTIVSNYTLTECLSDPRQIDRRFRATVIRSRFRHAKTCLVVSVSDFETYSNDEGGSVSPSFLQTLDIEVSVPITHSDRTAFKRVISEIKSEDMVILEDECNLGASWWAVAENCCAAPIVAGGWDEFCHSGKHLCVLLSISTERLIFARRGYARCAASVDCLEADLTYCMDFCEPKKLWATTRNAFDFVARGKLYDGMLCRRPLRRYKRSDSTIACVGELVQNPPWCGGSISIADLFALACRTLQTGDPSCLSPSLVRRLTGSRFMGIIFCRATCKCNRCFKTLIDSSSSDGGKSGLKCSQSFWHLPAPGGLVPASSLSQSSGATTSTLDGSLPHVKQSFLRCPNNCHLKHLAIQWECSGVLDDGTGQAKVYADREAALTILNFNSNHLDQIEQSMWLSSCPEIRYQKSVPPRKELQDHVCKALAQCGGRRRDPLALLPPAIKAEYLIHQHCRLSRLPRRSLEYFVRCKPLSDSLKHLNHDSLETYSSSVGSKDLKLSGQASSYKLPAMKLELVDCLVTSHGY